MKTLIVVDMQFDFTYGPLGTKEARDIIPRVQKKIEEYHKRGERKESACSTLYEVVKRLGDSG